MPAWIFVGACFAYEFGRIALHGHTIMEGAIARSPVGKFIKFNKYF
jgi:hypothetical protein